MPKHSKLFEDVFMGSGVGSPQFTCDCGRTHFGGDHNMEPGEHEALLEKARRNPSRYIHHAGEDGVSAVAIGGYYYVRDCPCEMPSRFELQLIGNQKEILEYYSRAAEVLRGQLEATQAQLGKVKR